jgi:hypothetical protein
MKSILLIIAALLVGFIGLMPINKPGFAAPENMNNMQKATFAGGCFWCMEKPFETLPGVVSVTSGYAGGTNKNPTYQNYAAYGHIEVVEIVFDPAQVSYEKLLEVEKLIQRQYSTMMKSSGCWLKNPRKRLTKVVCMTNRW